MKWFTRRGGSYDAIGKDAQEDEPPKITPLSLPPSLNVKQAAALFFSPSPRPPLAPVKPLLRHNSHAEGVAEEVFTHRSLSQVFIISVTFTVIFFFFSIAKARSNIGNNTWVTSPRQEANACISPVDLFFCLFIFVTLTFLFFFFICIVLIPSPEVLLCRRPVFVKFV